MKCVASPPYRTSAEQKLRSKNLAKSYRFGSQTLRDKLREKCSHRVREARQSRFNQQRLGTISEKFDFDELLRKELAELESDLQLQEEIFKELHDEMNEWYAEQVEMEDNRLFEAVRHEEDPNNVSVVCPICKLSHLSCTIADDQLYNVYSCTCGACFNFPADIVLLRSTLQSKIDLHEQYCDQPLCFFLEPLSVSNVLAAAGVGGNTLSALCGRCDYFCSL